MCVKYRCLVAYISTVDQIEGCHKVNWEGYISSLRNVHFIRVGNRGVWAWHTAQLIALLLIDSKKILANRKVTQWPDGQETMDALTKALVHRGHAACYSLNRIEFAVEPFKVLQHFSCNLGPSIFQSALEMVIGNLLGI